MNVSFERTWRSHELQGTITDALRNANITHPNYALFITGSDGRCEQGSVLQEIDTILVFKTNEDANKACIDQIQKTLNFPFTLEVKTLDQDSLLRIHISEQRHPPFPTRGLDAFPVSGSPEIWKLYKRTFFDQLCSSKGGKDFAHFNRSVLTKARNLLEAGMVGTILPEWNIFRGEFYYDNDRIKATKYTHLRVVQYTLAYHIFKKIRKKELGFDDFIRIPRTTSSRLQQLATDRNISRDLIQRTIHAYNQALEWKEQAQQAFVDLHPPLLLVAVIQVDLNTQSDVSNTILTFYNTIKSLHKTR